MVALPEAWTFMWSWQMWVFFVIFAICRFTLENCEEMRAEGAEGEQLIAAEDYDQ